MIAAKGECAITAVVDDAALKPADMLASQRVEVATAYPAHDSAAGIAHTISIKNETG